MHVVENLMRSTSSDTTSRSSAELESRTSDKSRASGKIARGGSPEFWSPRGACPEGLDGTELEEDLDWDFSPVPSDLD